MDSNKTINKQVLEDEAFAEPEVSIEETARGLRLISRAVMQRQMKANEVQLKGFFVDWMFDKLNLTKYR